MQEDLFCSMHSKFVINGLEQVLRVAGSRRNVMWKREKLGERRKRTFCETPARSGRMVTRRASICCATVLRNTYWLRPLAQAAAAAAAALNFRHASLLCARCFAPAAAETIKLALTCQHHGVPTPGTATLSFPNLPLHTNADGREKLMNVLLHLVQHDS